MFGRATITLGIGPHSSFEYFGMFMQQECKVNDALSCAPCTYDYMLLIMAALCNRAGHYIFALWFLSSIYLSFFCSSPNLSGHRLDVYHTSTHGVGPSANLECKSRMCCSRLAANTGRKKVAKNRYLGTIAQLRLAISSQIRHVSTIGKKLVKQQYLLHMSS